MIEKNTEQFDEDNEEVVVTFVDEDGKEDYFIEEMIIEVNGEKFSLLVPTEGDEVASEHEHSHECSCHCQEEDDDTAFFAKIVVNEKGEEEYIIPTDEEFEAACKAYDELIDVEG